MTFQKILFGSLGALTLFGIGGAAAVVTQPYWRSLVTADANKSSSPNHSHADGHDHAGHDHEHEGSKGIELSEQARENLGLKTGCIKFQDWWRTVSMPGIVSEQPGHSERRITTALNGIIVKVHVFPGQSVRPGDSLFDLQPTGELLTTAQASLLKTLQDLELLEIELKRIAPLVESGSLSAKTKLEKDYEKKRLESQRLIQMQELLVRGLTPEQIGQIIETKSLIREFTIRVPGGEVKSADRTGISTGPKPRVLPVGLSTFLNKSPQDDDSDIVYSVESIDIFPGKLVQPGDELCDLALHTKLNIVGHAFEREASLVARAIQERWPICAIFETAAGEPLVRDGLLIRFAENTIDPSTRTLRFHIPLSNEVLRDDDGEKGIVYRSWLFKPGQKVRLLLRKEHLKQQIVIPAEAIAKEGADAFVFRANGRMFERVAIQIEHLDAREAVLKNDGTLVPGDLIAWNQAYQLNLAINKAQGGGGGHSHEGHNH